MRTPRVWLGLILLLVFGVYARSIANDFAYDDRHYVKVPSDEGLPNDMVGEWQGLGTYFTSFYGEGAVGGGRGFRPVTVISFAITHALFQSKPGPEFVPNGAGPQRVVNILLQMLATCLVYLLIRRLSTESPWPAVAAAACFGLHALRSDPVISIVGRAEILALSFGVGAQLLYLGALDRRGGARAGLAAAAALCLFLAFGSKESSLAWVAFLPLVAAARTWLRDSSVAVLDVLKQQALPWLIAVIVPVVVFLALAYPILTREGFDIVTVNNPLRQMAFDARFYTAVTVLAHGLFQVFLPFWLHIDYSFDTFPEVTQWSEFRFLISLAALLFVSIGGVLLARKSPLLFLGAAMFFGFSFATSNIPFIVETVYGERLMYTPATGLCFLVAYVAHRYRAGGVGYSLLALAAAWVLMCGIVIVHRCTVWQDNRTLFIHEAETQPKSQRMQMAAGRQFRLEGEAIGFEGPRGQECLHAWRTFLLRALAVREDQNHPLPLNDLAYLHLSVRDKLLREGNLAEAEKQENIAKEFIERGFQSPYFEKKLGANLHYLMSRVHERRDEKNEQLRHLKLALEADPGISEAHIWLAGFFARNGRKREAIDAARTGLREFPEILGLRIQALDIAEQVGDDQACAEFLVEGERQNPEGNPHLQIYRALWLARRGQHGPALQLFQVAMPRFRSPPPPAAWLAIPQSLASIGQTEQARRVLDQHLTQQGIPPAIREAMLRLKQRLSN